MKRVGGNFVGVGRKAVEPEQVHGPGKHGNPCLTPTPTGWFRLYKDAPEGERSLRDFEDLTLRRVEMLATLHQEEGLGRYQFNDILANIAKGAEHNSDTFAWFPKAGLEESMREAEQALLSSYGLTEQLVSSTERPGVILDDSELRDIEEFKSEWKQRKQHIISKAWSDALVNDSIAHHACRIAFCGLEKWRNWFMKYEEMLFRGRVQALSGEAQEELFRLNNCNVERVSNDDPVFGKFLYNAECRRSHVARKQSQAEALRGKKYYKIRFTEVTQLVKDRKVPVVHGYALVPHDLALTLIYSKFRSVVAKGLNDALRAKGDIESAEGDRIGLFLEKLVTQFTMGSEDENSKGTSETVNVEDIETHADLHMPLCMRQMDKALRRDRHLKFEGRWQYGMFLKRMGLSCEQLTQFFGETMTLKGGGSVAKFAKSSYGYSVRHWYGKEGKKTSYSASNCTTIINGPAPKGGQCHGCPFRHYSEGALRDLLKEPRPHPFAEGERGFFGKNISMRNETVEAIIGKTKTGHYTAACRMYFAKTHPGYPEDASLFVSPHAYWATSVEFLKQHQQKKEVR